MSLVVRRAEPGDAPAVAGVHRLSRAAYYGTAPDPEDRREELWQRLLAEPGRTTTVVERSGEVVGFGSWVEPQQPDGEWELTAMYVLPEQVGQGLGRLLHGVFDGQRPPTDGAVLEVWAGNARAIDFYRRRGWVGTTTTRPGPRDLPFVTYRLPPAPVVRGTVREWHDDEGWGVVDTGGAPGGCWVHFSCVLVEGYRSLEPGQAVELVVEAGPQDGYDHRAVEVWPAGATPVRPSVGSGPSAAYTSSLSLTYDDDA